MPFKFDQSRDEIAQLVGQFDVSKYQYLESGHKEAQTRQFLIDPFFVALGWDVHNVQGLSPDDSEGYFEDSVEIEGQKKAPDCGAAGRPGTRTSHFAEIIRQDPRNVGLVVGHLETSSN
jgi:hypothetical protein